METVVLTSANLQEAAEKAAAVIHRGGVVLYPTETLYGLGADATSDEAVKKIYAIKGRPEGKPIHALILDESMAARYGEITPEARLLMEQVHEPLSLIVRKKSARTGGIMRGIDTFGFRRASYPFCVALVKAVGGPVTTTSANRAGTLPYRSVPQILEQIGDGVRGIDLVIDAGELPPSAASSIVDLSSGRVDVIREGTVSATDIYAVVGKGSV